MVAAGAGTAREEKTKGGEGGGRALLRSGPSGSNVFRVPGANHVWACGLDSIPFPYWAKKILNE